MESVFPNRDTYEFVLYFSGVFFIQVFCVKLLFRILIASQFITWNENIFLSAIFLFFDVQSTESFSLELLKLAFHWVWELSRFFPCRLLQRIQNVCMRMIWSVELFFPFFPSQNWTYFLFTLLFSCCLVSIRMYRSFNMSCRVLIFCTQDSSPT